MVGAWNTKYYNISTVQGTKSCSQVFYKQIIFVRKIWDHTFTIDQEWTDDKTTDDDEYKCNQKNYFKDVMQDLALGCLSD